MEHRKLNEHIRGEINHRVAPLAWRLYVHLLNVFVLEVVFCEQVNIVLFCLYLHRFSSSSDGKESACNAGDPGFGPWVRRIPWRRKWQSTPVFLPGEFHGQRSLVGYSLWCCKESDMTGRLTHMHITSLRLNIRNFRKCTFTDSQMYILIKSVSII